MDKQNFNTKDAARYLCISKSKLMKLCCYRKISFSKIGRLNIFTEQNLSDYLEKNRVKTKEELQKEAEDVQLSAKK
jgi:excisionase family DNA binding protein